mmetsp:Transcript_20873/g.30678  ORF Transcript_20873/g.30678 Transcript_20873/m.30678 type:complete len:555 (+) Transcript_20873:223-1887(+)
MDIEFEFFSYVTSRVADIYNIFFSPHFCTTHTYALSAQHWKAIMAVSTGPSGPNDVYLYNLDTFLTNAASSSSPAAAAAASFQNHNGDWDTRNLASVARFFFQKRHLYFLFGAGSNQHNQLLLYSKNNGSCLVNGEEAHDLKEIVLVVSSKEEENDSNGIENAPRLAPPKAKRLFAGGGHSGLLTEDGNLYLWGWNEYGQLGRSSITTPLASSNHESDDGMSYQQPPMPEVQPLRNIKVRTAALGHAHTLIVEDGTGNVYAFGDNGRGQVDGTKGTDTKIDEPKLVPFLIGEDVVAIAAGLFHSAVITSKGELITFGCGRFGQSLTNGINGFGNANGDKSDVAVGRWKPEDGARLISVACGQRHTIMSDDRGRIWTMGDNKYGQLGRGGGKMIAKGKYGELPQLVDGILGREGSGCYEISCGWSHNIALVRDNNNSPSSKVSIFGWGRNDKGQLGMGSVDNNVSTPCLLHDSVGDDKAIQTCCCGAESSMAIDEDGNIWGCGWNEHGNLSIGRAEDTSVLTKIVGARITKQPLGGNSNDILFAVGGAHFISLMR